MGFFSSIANFFDDDDDDDVRDEKLDEEDDDAFDEEEVDHKEYEQPVEYDPQAKVDEFTPLLQVVAMYNGTQYAYLKHESMVYRSIDGGDWEPIDGFFDQKYEVFIGSNDIIGFVESGEEQHPFGVFHANGSISTWGDDTTMGEVVKARVNKTDIHARTGRKSKLNTRLDKVTGVAPSVNYTAMAWADNVVSDRDALEAARSGHSVTRVITAAMVSSVTSVLANTVSEAVYSGLAKAATSKMAKDLANKAALAAVNSAVGQAARRAAGEIASKAATKLAGQVAQSALSSAAKSASKKAASAAAKKAASSVGKEVASSIFKGLFS